MTALRVGVGMVAAYGETVGGRSGRRGSGCVMALRVGAGMVAAGEGVGA